MIDHILGRPSVKLRKVQVFAVVSTWAIYLASGNRHGPPGARRISEFLTRKLTTWQVLVCTLLTMYISRNFGKLVGLECPEPLANLYTPAFFRATWITTALDAGYWSAMHIKKKWFRETCSIIFTLYYLVMAEQADEKVRKVRSVITIDHLRVAWNKQSDSPLLRIGNGLVRPRFMKYQPRAIRIPRPSGSAYADPVHAWLYFDGPVSALKKHTKLVLNFHGGGWIAMSPRTHDDTLLAWAGKTRLPVLCVDYRKAPEFPYPYALNECYDVYRTIFETKGRCVGFSGETEPRVILSGDSAGGNLAASVTLMILQSGSTDSRRRRDHQVPHPEGLVLVYPALDVNIGNWMTDDQMALIKDRSMRQTNRRVLERKNSEYRRMAPSTPIPTSSDSDSEPSLPRKASATNDSSVARADMPHSAADVLPKSRLAVPSLISYVSDRLLTPEMMRAMIILYIGPHIRPDFSTDFLLSPVLAPDALLAQFPKTYFLTGERDPLVDDTVIMAGRIRAAKRAAWEHRAEMGLLERGAARRGFDGRAHVEVSLVAGASHGFIQMASIFPDAWKYIYRVGGWYESLFAAADARARAAMLGQRRGRVGRAARGGDAPLADLPEHAYGRRRSLVSSEDEAPIEIGSGTAKMSRSGVPPPLVIPQDEVFDRSADLVATPGELMSSRPVSQGAEEGFSREHPLRQSRSSVSLASEDDFLGRRMRGLVGGLTRTVGGEES